MLSRLETMLNYLGTMLGHLGARVCDSLGRAMLWQLVALFFLAASLFLSRPVLSRAASVICAPWEVNFGSTIPVRNAFVRFSIDQRNLHAQRCQKHFAFGI